MCCRLDQDGDGRVSSKEWGQSLAANPEVLGKYFEGSSIKEIAGAFNRCDIDKSGCLNWAEFETATTPVDKGVAAAAQNALAKAMTTDEGKAELRLLFDTMDADGNGSVSAQEWSSKICENKALASKFFGDVSAINMDDANSRTKTWKVVRESFERLDMSGDGQLTWEEFEFAAANKGVKTKSKTAGRAMDDAMQTDEGKADLKAVFET